MVSSETDLLRGIHLWHTSKFAPPLARSQILASMLPLVLFIISMTMTPTFQSAMLSSSPGVTSRAELVTLALGLRPERRFAPLARGL